MLYFTVDLLKRKYEELKSKKCKDIKPEENIWHKLKEEKNKDSGWLFKLLIARFIDYGMNSEKASKVLLEMDKKGLLELERVKSDIESDDSEILKIFKKYKVMRKFRGKKSKKKAESIFKDLKKLVNYVCEKYNCDLNKLKDEVLKESKKVDDADRDKFIVNSLLIELSSLPGFGEKQASLFLRETVDFGVWKDVKKEYIPISIDQHIKEYFEALSKECGFPKRLQDWQILLLAELMAMVNNTSIAELDYLIWCTQRAKH